jgi:hypothetical protein
MKGRKETQGAGRKAQGRRKEPGQPKTLTPDRGPQKTGVGRRVPASSLIAVEALRPLNVVIKGNKRKRCPDCRYCQGCSQDRCRLCRGKKKPGPLKLSLTEQIALYDKINRPKGKKPAP